MEDICRNIFLLFLGRWCELRIILFVQKIFSARLVIQQKQYWQLNWLNKQTWRWGQLIEHYTILIHFDVIWSSRQTSLGPEATRNTVSLLLSLRINLYPSINLYRFICYIYSPKTRYRPPVSVLFGVENITRTWNFSAQCVLCFWVGKWRHFWWWAVGELNELCRQARPTSYLSTMPMR